MPDGWSLQRTLESAAQEGRNVVDCSDDQAAAIEAWAARALQEADTIATATVRTMVIHTHQVRLEGVCQADLLRAAADWLDDHPDVDIESMAVATGTQLGADVGESLMLSVYGIREAQEIQLDDEAVEGAAVGSTPRQVRAASLPRGYLATSALRIIRPGDTLRAFMDEYNLGVIAVAARCGWPQDSGPTIVEQILAGTYEITPEIASSLNIGTQIPSRLWLIVEDHYRRALAAGAVP